MGARLAGNPVAFVAAFSLVWAMVISGIFVGVRGFAWPRVSRRDATTAFAGGALAIAGYATVVWAMTIAPMGLVSALRETSVIFAALIARAFLNERLTAGRLGACVVIASGGALLSS
jgi:drug/metabolite transporter (DMT)-like permease